LNDKPVVVDLFCGAGGLTHGFLLEEFGVVAGVDSDETCRYAYESNNGATFIKEDVFHTSPETISNLFGKAETKILVGCAPCQPFSSYNLGDRKKDDKWRLLYRFSELIQAVEPDVFSMENVPTLKIFDNGKVLRDFMHSLERSGYSVVPYEVNCPDYGIPQHRKRLVVFGSKHGKIKLIPPTCDPEHYKTVADTIAFLPPIAAGEVSSADPLHRAARLSDLNQRRIRQSKPSGTWRDWDDDLVVACHRKRSGKSYPSVYGRMSWNKPAPTMTTLCFGYGNGRFGHPEQNRAISLREAALFQTFPEGYSFVPPDGEYVFRILGRQIGNAVPVDLGRIIARSIKKHLEETIRY